MKSFEELGLSKPLLDMLKEAGLDKPSEIQEKAIPLILKGKDVIGNSATGSGKTLAFGSGIIERVEKGKGIQALILTPTRELAEQIGNVFKKFSSFKNLDIAIVYGGVNMGHQVRDLKKAEIVIGTPGRTLDHLEKGTLDLSDLKMFVLDEADRMLDMGFIRDVEKIIKNCPKERQTLLFSATIPWDIEELTFRYMKNPEKVSAESYVDASKLKQVYYDVERSKKFSLLVHLLKNEKPGLVMVFCNTRHNTDFVADNLIKMKIDSVAIHGGLTQDKRNKIIKKFHEKSVFVLVCTDVAARGLDIKGVSHVYNYDIPKTSQDYVHRIGRTARAGKEGIAINILCDRDYENFNNVIKDESLNIVPVEVPKMERVRIMLNNPRDQGKRNRWDSDDWRSRNKAREGIRSGRGSTDRGRSQTGGSHSRGSQGSRPRSGGRGNYSHGGSSRPRSGGRNIRQRSGNYRQGGRPMRNSPRGNSSRGRR